MTEKTISKTLEEYFGRYGGSLNYDGVHWRLWTACGWADDPNEFDTWEEMVSYIKSLLA